MITLLYLLLGCLSGLTLAEAQKNIYPWFFGVFCHIENLNKVFPKS